MTTKQEAGRLGGLATVRKYGHKYIATIGAKGAKTLWRRYRLVPVQLTKFALMDRKTAEVKTIK